MQNEMLSTANMLAGLAFAFLTFAFYAFTVAFVHFLPSVNSETRTLSSLKNLLTYIFLWLVTAVSGAATSILQNWRYWVFAIVVILTGSALYAAQPQADKVEDAYQTTIVYPVANVFFYAFNAVRMLFNAVICFLNIAANLTRIVTNQFFSITFSCGEMDWSVFPDILKEFAVRSVNDTVSWTASRFTDDLKISPMIGSLADLLSALNPVIDCQCNDISFLWSIFINPTYGIIQSKHLHLLPEAVLNLQIATPRAAIVGGFEIAGRFLTSCNGSRACEVSRGPKFDDAMRLQCNVFTHSVDFLDDILYSIDTMIQVKLGLFVPWNSTPRPFGMWAMPLCAASDLFYVALDALTHFDLFWRISPYASEGNYVSELRIDTVFSRLYNFTYQLEQLGIDIGGDFAEPLLCVIGRTLRIFVAIADYVIGLVQYLLAYAFVNDPLGQYAESAQVQNITTLINENAAEIQICANNLGDELGHGGKYFVIGITATIDPLIRIVNGFVDNSGSGGDVLAYLGSFDFRADIEGVFNGLYIIVGSIGGALRTTGSFGSTTCTPRLLDDEPWNLEQIEMGSMDLNIMCALGTTVEMFLRYPITIVQYIVGIVAAICEIVVGIIVGPVTMATFAAPFQDNQAFDLGKKNGILETQCLLMDSIALIPPSLLTLGPQITCPSSPGVLVAQPLYDVCRSSLRSLGMGALWFARSILQGLGKLFCGGSSCLTFGTWCDTVIEPLWKSVVATSVQIFIAFFDFIGCLVPGGAVDSTLSTIGIALGRAFVDTRFGVVDIVVDCTDLINNIDGGMVIDVLCTFTETLATLVDMIMTIFRKGFWQAIWEWISGALQAVLNSLKEGIDCLLNWINQLFGKLGDCLGALVRVDRFFTTGPESYLNPIKDGCGNWGGVFSSCSISFKIQEFGIDSELPSPGYGTSTGAVTFILRYPAEMLGVCIMPDQATCLARSSIQEDHDGQTCAQVVTSQVGVKRLVLGQTCAEALAEPFDPLAPTLGACCIPGVGCTVDTFDVCDNTGSVWIANETCSSLDATCRVGFSDYSNQFGCCVTDKGVDMFSGDIRVAKSFMNAYDCYKSSEGERTYFIADDPTCSNVHPRLINETRFDLDDVVTGASLPYLRTPCTPQYELYQTQASKEVDVACIAQDGPTTTNVYTDQLPLRTKISGTGFTADNTIGLWWYCHDDSWKTRNSYVEGVNVDGLCSFQTGSACSALVSAKIYNFNNQILSFFFGTEKTTMFANTDSMQQRTIPNRIGLYNGVFEAECRFAWIRPFPCGGLFQCWDILMSNRSGPVTINSAFATGSFQTAAADQNRPAGISVSISGGVVTVLDGSILVNSDCRLRRKTTTGTPRFDEGFAFNNPANDLLMADLDDMSGLATATSGRTMTVLYALNTTFDLSRDNTNGRCNTFAPPVYPPPAPATTGTTGTTGSTGLALSTGTSGTGMAPDFFSETPIQRESDSDSARRRMIIGGGGFGQSAELSTEVGTNQRRLFFFEALDLFDLDKQLMNESHPCFMNYYHLKRSVNESDGLTFLLLERFDHCLLSDALSRAMEALLLWDSEHEGRRLVSPYVFYTPSVTLSTFMNMTKGVWNGFSYVGYYYQSYLEMKASGTNNTQFAVSWNQYANFNGVRDGLGYRIGSFIASIGRLFAAMDWQEITPPGGLGFFGFIMQIGKWSELTGQNYTFPPRTNMSEYDAPVISDTGWEWFNAWFNWTSSTNEDGITESGTNLTMALEVNRKVNNLKSFLTTKGGKIEGDTITVSATGGLCDPTDRSCLDCEIVVGTFETLVQVVENCVEDLQNTNRFNIDPTQVNLTRSNTFFQPGDKFGCADPKPLEETALLSVILDVLDLFFDSRYWTARVACYATNTDFDDLHSTLFYTAKIFRCDPINDGSAHRGRAGIGLWNAILVVGGVYLVLILLSAWFLPVIPVNWISLLILYLAINMLAYWSSPMCFFGSPIAPIPVIVDAVFDDAYVLARNAIPTNCTSYDPSITTQGCEELGRDFIDCKDYGFDGTGARHMAYLLETIGPGLGESLLQTSIPVLSSIVSSEYYSNALGDIDEIRGTPIGQFCSGLSPFSVRRIAPMASGTVQLLSFGILAVSLLSVALALLFVTAALLEFIINLGASLIDAVTFYNVTGRRWIRE